MRHRDEKTIVAFVFARGGSKGLPGKNIKLLGGKPLIAHSIELARSLDEVKTVIVSTDDPAIAEAALAAGAEVPFMRPAELAQDNSPEWLAWRHAISWYREQRGPLDIFLSLPPTSPLRAAEDVRACLDALATDAAADIAITVADAERSPYFNMVRLDEAGVAELVIQVAGGFARRQDVPRVYDVTTVAYAARPDYVLGASGLFAGKVKAVRVPRERALDIDTPHDFAIAQALYGKPASGER
jgi:N-acylneuraminate cytidylyltransferase